MLKLTYLIVATTAYISGKTLRLSMDLLIFKCMHLYTLVCKSHSDICFLIPFYDTGTLIAVSPQPA